MDADDFAFRDSCRRPCADSGATRRERLACGLLSYSASPSGAYHRLILEMRARIPPGATAINLAGARIDLVGKGLNSWERLGQRKSGLKNSTDIFRRYAMCAGIASNMLIYRVKSVRYVI